MGGTSEFDSRLVEQARREFRPVRRSARLYLSYGAAAPRNCLPKLANLPPHTVVLYPRCSEMVQGEAFVPHEVAERISRSGEPCPSMDSSTNSWDGVSSEGGYTASPLTASKPLAWYARFWPANSRQTCRCWKAAPASSASSWRQLQRWNISESSVALGQHGPFQASRRLGSVRPQLIAAHRCWSDADRVDRHAAVPARATTASRDGARSTASSATRWRPPQAPSACGTGTSRPTSSSSTRD